MKAQVALAVAVVSALAGGPERSDAQAFGEPPPARIDCSGSTGTSLVGHAPLPPNVAYKTLAIMRDDADSTLMLGQLHDQLAYAKQVAPAMHDPSHQMQALEHVSGPMPSMQNFTVQDELKMIDDMKKRSRAAMRSQQSAGSIPMDAQGKFSCGGLAPGRYVLVLKSGVRSMQGPNEQVRVVRVELRNSSKKNPLVLQPDKFSLLGSF